MKRNLHSLLLLSSVLIVFGESQQTADQNQIPAPAIRVTTHFVGVSVVATDKAGKPITDLKKDDFIVEEQGKKQEISTFDAITAASSLQSPKLPPNVYSNRPELSMPNGPLTIILIDALNTPVQNQTYARQQLLRYAANQLAPGQQVAIYGLTTRLVKLQDFTSDPLLLRKTIEEFEPQQVPGTPSANPAQAPHSEVLRGNADSSVTVGKDSAVAAANMSLLAAQARRALTQFEQDQTPTMFTARVEHTIEALNELARICGGHKGRKNIVWITASVPFTMVPDTSTVTNTMMERQYDPTGPAPTPDEGRMGAIQNPLIEYAPAVQRMAAMMASVQASVYPVDARGLLGIGATGDASVKMGMITDTDYANLVSAGNDALRASLDRMEEVANETGGRAMFNRNDVDNAISIAARDGANSYELGYYPSNKKYNGDYRKLKIKVNRPDVVLHYRDGYFAIDPGSKKNNKELEQAMSQAITAAAPATLVAFDALVIPPAPSANADVPIKILVDPSSFTMEDIGNSKRRVNLDFFAAAFGADGRMVKSTGKTISTDIDQGQFEQIAKQGLGMAMDLPLPPGDFDLRLAVRDNRTGYIGTVNIPLKLQKP